MAVPTTARPRGIRVRTDLGSEADFVAAFHELCDETTIFAPTEKMKPIGAACAFSLELADGTPMVRGLGTIRNAWPMMDSPFGRPGIHIEIDQLTTSTEPIFNRMLEARTAALARPRTRPVPSTHQLWGPPAGPPTEEMDVPAEPEEPVLHKRVTREIRGVADLTEDVTAEAENDANDRARPPTIPGAPIPVPRPRLASAPVPVVQSASGIDVDPALVAPPRPWWMNARVGAVFAGGIVLGLLFSLIFRPDPKKVTAAAPAVAKAEPAQCPPPPEAPPALAAAATDEPADDQVAEEPKTKARTAKAATKPKQVATATGAVKTAATSNKPAMPATKAALAKTAPVTATKPTTVAKTGPTSPKSGAITKPAPTTTARNSTTTTAKATAKASPTTSTAKTSTTSTAKTALTTKSAPTTATKTGTTTKTAPATTKATVAAKTAGPATKPTAAKPATTTTAKTSTAKTTVATSKTKKKPAKGACNSLDCL